MTRRSIERRHSVADPDIRRALADVGYVVVPFLAEVDLGTLREVLSDIGWAPGDDRSGLFNDTWSTDPAWKMEASRRLSEVLNPRISDLLPGHRPLGLAHIVKWPGEAGAVVAHRDPTFVDEGRFRSLMLWCPLHDVDVDDGALWVVPKSHRDRTGLRVHQSPENVVRSISCDPSGPARPVRMTAGQAILYDHALIHLSGANLGESARVAVASPVIPAEATTRYTIPVSPSDAAVIEIDEQFFLDHRLCALDTAEVLRNYPSVGSVRLSSSVR